MPLVLSIQTTTGAPAMSIAILGDVDAPALLEIPPPDAELPISTQAAPFHLFKNISLFPFKEYCHAIIGFPCESMAIDGASALPTSPDIPLPEADPTPTSVQLPDVYLHAALHVFGYLQ